MKSLKVISEEGPLGPSSCRTLFGNGAATALLQKLTKELHINLFSLRKRTRSSLVCKDRTHGITQLNAYSRPSF